MSADNPKPLFSDRPVTGSRPLAKILTIPPGPATDGIIISNHYLGVFTHYWNGRTVPCTGRLEPDGTVQGCQINHEATSSRWQGWLAMLLVKRRAIVFTAITDSAWRDCPQLHAANRHLRGMTIRLWRHGVAKNARLSAAIGAQLTNDLELPPAPDTLAFLENLWGRGHWFVRKQETPDDETSGEKKEGERCT